MQWFRNFLILRPHSQILHKRSAPAISYNFNCSNVQFIQQTFVAVVRDATATQPRPIGWEALV